ncbi:MAG TPA: hypothetical protein VNA22_04855 [Pyrinomonadaceae bacterium]|nr:hypothetical protein [Pyrinomonadaceae bacterium]
MIRSTLLLTFFALMAAATPTAAQFPIKIPKIPKAEKPKPTGTPERSTDKTEGRTDSPGAGRSQPGHVYPNEQRPSKPAVVLPRVFIKTASTNSYWKMPNVSGVTSWLPEIAVNFAFDHSSRIEAIAEYYNPDGSLWFAEKLQAVDGDHGLLLRSNETWSLMDTKSTNQTGIYSLKVKNKTTGEVMFSGRFRVNKFPASFNPTREKHKFGYFVDHDWLVPLGIVSLPAEDITKGINDPMFSVWLKGDVSYEELEAELIYNGRSIARRKATSGMSYDERTAEFIVPFAHQHLVKRWTFSFTNVSYQNGTVHNLDDLADTHWMDRNPGSYTFKVYRKGTQIREFTFGVGPDGRLVRPSYSDGLRFPQYGILLAAKMISTTEKWNPNAWNADMFYGNPLPGFTIQ